MLNQIAAAVFLDRFGDRAIRRSGLEKFKFRVTAREEADFDFLFRNDFIFRLMEHSQLFTEDVFGRCQVVDSDPDVIDMKNFEHGIPSFYG